MTIHKTIILLLATFTLFSCQKDADDGLVVLLADPLECEIDIDKYLISEGESIELSLKATDGTSPYTFEWSHGGNSQSTTIETEGKYSVTVTDALGETCFHEVNIESTTSSVEPEPWNGTIGNQIWIDIPGGIDGLFDAGDQSFEGVDVNLYDATTKEVIDSKTTDAVGNYIFHQIKEGHYQLEFIAPEGYTVSNASNVDPMSGMTEIFNLMDGTTILNIDVAYTKD